MKIITGKLFSHKGELKIPYVQNHHHNLPPTPKFCIATLDSSNVIPRKMLYFGKPKFEIGWPIEFRTLCCTDITLHLKCANISLPFVHYIRLQIFRGKNFVTYSFSLVKPLLYYILY